MEILRFLWSDQILTRCGLPLDSGTKVSGLQWWQGVPYCRWHSCALLEGSVWTCRQPEANARHLIVEIRLHHNHNLKHPSLTEMVSRSQAWGGLVPKWTVFECIECLLLIIVPMPCGVLLSQRCKWCCDMCKSLDESLIKISEPKKRLYVFDTLWTWPVKYCWELGRIHLNFILANDHAEIFNRWLLEEALLGF